MQKKKTTLIFDRLAFRSGSHYYPISLKKKVRYDGKTTFTIEMKIGRHDVIVSDAPTLEEVFERHEELIKYAFVTRNLQGCK